MYDKISNNLLHIAWTDRGHVHIVHGEKYILYMFLYYAKCKYADLTQTKTDDKWQRPAISSERTRRDDSYYKPDPRLNIWSWVSEGLDNKTDWLTDRQSQSDLDLARLPHRPDDEGSKNL
jgi:hypothetical protein